ncbi:MAG: DEAD/DEAH box helicase [Planctomycetaceae bacterium]|jgi:superfamily II DNA or RNA helicase/very-short-patch-repair endonuclease|nr:DEAD/DEAH box helicase [Planctomycetaceae bacterium]
MNISIPEHLFIALFSDTFGVEKTEFLCPQFPFQDIYQDNRFADFILDSGNQRIAFEIDDEASHHRDVVSSGKFLDDLLRQNSMIFLGWSVYRWSVKQLREQPETVKDELRLFLGNHPQFKLIQDYLPTQRGKTFDVSQLELRKHQQEALNVLAQMRQNHETIALLYHATGTGKTVTAILDAKSVGKRTLFLAHTLELVKQAYASFTALWTEKSVGLFVDDKKEMDTDIVCGSIQSMALHLDMFSENDFGYLIIDEAHHAVTDTYQKILSFFNPEFTLGLTATPERTDDVNILDIFKKTAHKLDLKTAVEIGELVPVRCLRIRTNIDLTKVKYNSIQYNSRDLEAKIFVPERNRLILETWTKFVNGKRTVIFCVSVQHAEEVVAIFQQEGIAAKSVSGKMKMSARNEIITDFADGKIKVLCACDLLNEGWDCPQTEVLFMSRPTMSKLLYLQQLGRGMRLSAGKECLMVFDFVDNANQFNVPYSLHRIAKLGTYRPGGFVFAPEEERRIDEDLYRSGEKPEFLLDYPINVLDYEAIDLFNWQEEAKGMISQMEFVRQVNVQSTTVTDYIANGKLRPDLSVPISEHRTFNYFKKETLEKAVNEFGWIFIIDDNRWEIFLEFVKKMDMQYSYKPVFMKAFLAVVDEKGIAKLEDIAEYFCNYYEQRRKNGWIVEKSGIFARGDYTNKDAVKNILSNPFRVFEEMNFIHHSKTIGFIQIDGTIWKHLDKTKKNEILTICDEKLNLYFKTIKK